MHYAFDQQIYALGAPSRGEYMARCEQRLQAPEPNTFSFVIRRRDSEECLGMAAVEACDMESPELGLWMKESAHGQGLGREVVTAVAAVLAVIPPFDEYLRSRRSRLGRHRKVRRHHIAVRDRADP